MLEQRWWYNPRTGEVEEGRQSPWTDRMGPYDTREEAMSALRTAADRSEAWDEEDRRWKDDDWPDEA
jgi:hypothetical protein